MKEITEDYVSFEVAKLLKEKGFDWECRTRKYYPEPEYDAESPNGVYAPTHQMALKWLREVHKIIITIDFDEYELESQGTKVGYGYNLQLESNPREFAKISEMVYDSYEETVEAAIKYCLENLI